MQAVILAGGKSTRMQPLTCTRPKPLLPLLDTTILEHNINELCGLVDEIIIVVGYLSEQIIDKVTHSYRSTPIRYIKQDEPKGTGHALWCAKGMLSKKFLVLNGDDVYAREDIERCLEYEHCVLASRRSDTERFGVLVTKNGRVENVIEKPTREDVGHKNVGLVNTGLYVLSQKVFDHNFQTSARGEFELTDVIKVLGDVAFREVVLYWNAVSYPWNLLEANIRRLKDASFDIQGEVRGNVHIDGRVSIDVGSIIYPGTYIEGPVYICKNCTIGPSAYLRPGSIVLDNCHLGFGTEIVESIIMPGTVCKHRSYIGYSVIGSNCNIGAGFITADYRHDGGLHTTFVKGKKVTTYREKLGAFLGDRVMTGIHTSIYPGRKIWAGVTTLPGEVVSKDKKDISST